MKGKNPLSSDQRTPYADLTVYNKKRKAGDRRQRPTSLFSRYLFRGRRRGIRRVEEEGDGYYVDRFGLADWIPPVALLLVSVADLLLTAAWLNAGGTEGNVIMAWLVGKGGVWFALVKIVFTLFAAGFFLLHSRFRSARFALGSLIVLYGCLLAYHGYNFGRSGLDAAEALVSLVR